MVTVGMNYRVIAGKEEPFEKMFAKVLEAMASMDGHSETHLYRDVSDPQSYLIVSYWNSRAKYDAFITSDQFKKVTDWGKESILAARPKHEVYGADEPAGSGGGCPVSH